VARARWIGFLSAVMTAACCVAPAAEAALGSAARLPSGSSCPHKALILPADGVARAAAAALAELQDAGSSRKPSDVVIESAARSTFAGDRGGEVRHQCGRSVAARTVVVQALYPRLLPSASLSEGVVFVSRFRHGFRIWEVAH
jgi:hypothetical protein